MTINEDLIRQMARQSCGGFLDYDETGYRLSEREVVNLVESVARKLVEQFKEEIQYEYDWNVADSVGNRVLSQWGIW